MALKVFLVPVQTIHILSKLHTIHTYYNCDEIYFGDKETINSTRQFGFK